METHNDGYGHIGYEGRKDLAKKTWKIEEYVVPCLDWYLGIGDPKTVIKFAYLLHAIGIKPRAKSEKRTRDAIFRHFGIISTS